MVQAGIFPRRVEIEISSKCNMECEFCPRRFIPKNDIGFMDISLFKKIIDEISVNKDVVAQLHRRGESLLNPHFNDMLKHMEGVGIKTQIATNAILLDEEKAHLMAKIMDFVSFSMDTPDNYCRKKGVDMATYELAVKNIRYFLGVNKKAKVQVSMVKCDDTTENDILDFKKQWLGAVDVVRIYAEHSKNGNFGSLAFARGSRMPCTKPSTDVVIFWNGKVARCNHDWYGSCAGSVEKESIKDIWNNDFYNDLRRQHSSLLITDEICKKCDSWYAEEGCQNTGEIFANDRDKGDAYGT